MSHLYFKNLEYYQYTIMIILFLKCIILIQ